MLHHKDARRSDAAGPSISTKIVAIPSSSLSFVPVPRQVVVELIAAVLTRIVVSLPPAPLSWFVVPCTISISSLVTSKLILMWFVAIILLLWLLSFYFSFSTECCRSLYNCTKLSLVFTCFLCCCCNDVCHSVKCVYGREPTFCRGKDNLQVVV